MALHYLRIEGVNFSSVLYDTDDLSVIRGASLMLASIDGICRSALDENGVSGIRLLSHGAGQAEFAFDASDDQAVAVLTAVRQALLEEPWRHLSFVVDLADSLEAAQARNRTRQCRQWTVPDCRAPGARRPDALDRTRGALVDDGQNRKGWVSEATKARLEYGRKMRHGFFVDRLGEAAVRDVTFCESFEELIADAPETLLEAVQNKIAVIHFDGDQFGRIAKAATPETFARELGPKLDALLRRLVGDALFAEEQEYPGAKPRLRMETLVWGGDDITLVVPAWRALDCIAGFMEETRAWEIGSRPLTFTGGAIIANYKAPIRQLTRLAGEAVERSKEAGARDAFTIDIFESAAPPEDGLRRHRQRVFASDIAPSVLAFPGSDADTLTEAMGAWHREGGETRPSRSRLIDLVFETSAPGLSDSERDSKITTALARDADRVQWGALGNADILRLPALKGTDRPLWTDLRLVAELWQYAGHGVQ